MAKYALNYPKRVLAVTDSNRSSLMSSASGGAFAVLARAVLSLGGKVYGAMLCDDGRVFQSAVSELDDLIRLQGSKYVWSDLGNSINHCVDDLRSGKLVLYSGVPCQIAALVSRVNTSNLSVKEKANLITCDLICHGTPKAELFQAYLTWLASRHSADNGIHDYRFRTKDCGWGSYRFHYSYEKNGRRHEMRGSAGDDPYYYAFSRGVIYRPCCYSCSFARSERVGDFTLGDYWGVGKVEPGAFDSAGVSALLINTDKGLLFFESYAADLCNSTVSTMESVRAFQTNLTQPTKRSLEDEKLAIKIDAALSAGDYRYIFEKLLTPDNSWKARIRRLLPNSLIQLMYRLRVG